MASSIYHAPDPQALQMQLLPHFKALQTRVSNCSDAARKKDERDYDQNDCITPMIKSFQMVYTAKPPLSPSSAGNIKRLVKARYKKLNFTVVGPFVIVRAQNNTLAINDHSIHNTASINRATLASGNDRPTRALQGLTVKETLQKENGICTQITKQHPKNSHRTNCLT